MFMQLLSLTPYAAIAASLLLVITVAMTCHMQARSDHPSQFAGTNFAERS